MSRIIRYKVVLGLIIVLIGGAYPNRIFAAPQSLQAELADGTILKVHLEEELASQDYARQVLQAACAAYEEIVFRQGFNRVGYSFARSDRFFAYDSDRTIDIYLADVPAPAVLIKPAGGLEYKAKILIPADYQEYRQRYKINKPELELQAALMHELVHIITYSYNRNMQSLRQGSSSLTSQPWDWYTEGLARYFETLTGYRDDFLSFGFRERCGREIKVYRGGANYFLSYPDRPLDERKYDFALFWQYLHQNYGMDKIEEISVKFRQVDPKTCSNQEAMQIIAQTLGVSLEELLRNFSLYVYRISSSSDEVENGFRAVTLYKLSGRRIKTSCVSSFGYDFYEIDLNKEGLESIQLKALNGDKGLNCLIGTSSSDGFYVLRPEDNNSGKIKVDVQELPENSKMIIMLSNPTNQTIPYRIYLN